MKFLRFLLVAVLILGLAVIAVNFIMDRRGTPGGTETSLPTESGGAEATDPSQPTQPQIPVLPMSDYRCAGSFHEGKLLVERKSDAALVCIDQQGKILFELESKYRPYQLVHSRFYNGLALITTGEDILLCTADGRVLSPGEFGGKEFLFAPLALPSQQERFFADGYILVSDDDRFGLLNSNLEWAVPMSQSYRQSVMTFAAGIAEAGWDTELYYGGGCFLSKAGCFNIITCETGGISQLPERPGHDSDYWTEMWGANTLMFLDDLCRELVLGVDLGSYVKPLMEAGSSIVLPVYEDGYAGVLSVGDGGNLFTVVDEQGQTCFEAVSVFGETVSYDHTGGYYCVAGDDGTGHLKISIFNTEGLLSEYSWPIPSDAVAVEAAVEDGVILIRICFENDEAVCLYNMDFLPLY